MTDTWRFEQIAPGVSRWPTDVDQDCQLLNERAATSATSAPPRTGWETCCWCREFRGLQWIKGAWWCWRHKEHA
jgi:hypothetical protein